MQYVHLYYYREPHCSGWCSNHFLEGMLEEESCIVHTFAYLFSLVSFQIGYIIYWLVKKKADNHPTMWYMIFNQIICSGGYRTFEIQQYSEKYAVKRYPATYLLHSTIDCIKYFLHSTLIHFGRIICFSLPRVYPVNFILYNWRAMRVHVCL